jgi:hypothetical protein
MRTEKHEKVLEKLATSDKATFVIERQPEAKCALRSRWSSEQSRQSRDRSLSADEGYMSALDT